MRKPVVIYVEESTIGFFGVGNTQQQALCFYFKNELGLDVISYENFWKLRDDSQRIIKLIKQKIIALLVFKESRWDEEHYSSLSFIRDISNDVLIWIQRDYFSDFPFKNKEGDLNIFYGETPDILKQLANYLKDWQIPDTWLGVESEYEEHLLMNRLERAYDRFSCEEDLFFTPDYNHKIVSEVLRLRLLPPEFIGEHLGEFDQDVFLKIKSLSVSPSFDSDMEKIRNMDDEERSLFSYLLSKKKNSPDGISWGNNVMGFAIDPITLEMEISGSHGMHANARDHLSYRIEEIAHLSKKYFYHDDYSRIMFDDYRLYCLSRIISGLLFKQVKDFKSPIVKLFISDSKITEEYLNRALNHLIGLKKMIPVSCDGILLDVIKK